MSYPLTGREWVFSLLWAIVALAMGGWLLDQLMANDAVLGGRWPIYDERHDDQAYVATRICCNEGSKATFVVLGNSSIREAFWPDARMTQTLAAQGRFLNLSSSSQNAIEAFFLVEAIAPRPGQIFVVFLNATSLRQEDPLARLGAGAFLRSPMSLRDIDGPSAAWSIPGAAQWMDFQAHRQLFQRLFRFRLKRWAREYFYGQPMVDYETYRYESAARPNQIEIDAQEGKMRQEMKEYFAANLHQQTDALEAMQRLVRQHGAQLVLAASPRPARVVAGLSGYEAEFVSAVGAFARKQGIAWLDLNHGIDWQADDFFDLTHLGPSGRDKWSQAFINWLAVRASGEPGPYR